MIIVDEIEQVKERLDIAEVVGSYLTLKRAGANLKGPCPFHNEKTPSFMVNPERQIFKCFGCGEGGDIFTFIEKIEGVDFYNALKILADRAGVTLSSRSVKRGDTEHKADIKTTLFEVNNLAAKLYHKLLTDHAKAGKARLYLEDRGLTPETITRFRIGYAPDSWDFLIRFMESKNYKRTDVYKAGMLAQNDRGEYYDRFRGRIIFPINNVMGSCVGFTSRVLVDDGKQAKYVNSSESPIYHKGKVLYGLDLAKLPIREQGMAVVVEGQMDVIACHQAGFTNVVASSGTAFTEEQLLMLNRYAPVVAFAFDADVAGEAAMRKAIQMSVNLDISIKIIEIPLGFKDPDEAIKNDPKIWQNAVAGARPAIEAWVDKLARKTDMSDISSRRKIAKEVLPMIKQINSAMEKEHYLKYLAKKLAVSEASLLSDLDHTKTEDKNKPEAVEGKIALSLYQKILAIAWTDTALASIASAKINAEDLKDKDLAHIWQLLTESSLDSKHLKAEEIAQLDQWSYQNSLDYEDATQESLKEELLFLISRLKQEKNEDVKEKYAALIKQAQEQGDSQQLKKLLQEFSELLKG